MEKNSTFRFPYYYQVYFNVLFLLCLSPIWVSNNAQNKCLRLKSNIFQKVICIILLSCVLILSVLNLRKTFTAKIKDEPKIVYALFNNLLWSSYAFGLAYTVWFKRQKIAVLLTIQKVEKSCTNYIKGLLFVLVGLIYFSTYYVLFEVLDENLHIAPPDDYRRGVLYMYGFANNDTNADLELLNQLGIKILVRSTPVFDVLYSTTVVSTEVLVLISCFAMYEMTGKCLKDISNNYYNIEALLNKYVKLKQYVDRVNGFDGLLLLFVFVQILSYLSSTLVDVLDEESIKNRLLLGESYLMYTVMLWLAAESNFKIKLIEKHISRCHLLALDTSKGIQNQNPSEFQTQTPIESYEFVNSFMKAAPGQPGLTGGRFFIITYPFLGMCGSLLLTYTIVMIQFQAT